MVQPALADRHYVEWYTYDDLTTPALVMDSRHWSHSGYMLMSLSGASDTLVNPKAVSAPGQVGDTLVDVDITSRVTAMTVLIAAGEHEREAYWTLKDAFIRAMYTPKPRGNMQPRKGRLVLYRPGKDPVELECMPRKAPTEGNRPDNSSMIVTVDFYAPEPYWRALADVLSPFGGLGGFEFPLEHPFEMTSFNIGAIVDNVGHVEVPVVARIYGNVTNPKLENVTTGESFTITGTIGEGDYVEISTRYGQKAVTYHYADGTTENWLPNLDLSVSSFWMLSRGENEIHFSATTNISGSAEIDWRPQFAGV